jgi:hypothetical protein
MPKKYSHLNKNMKALKETVPGLQKWVRDQPDLDWFEEIQSSNGMPNLLVQDGAKKNTAYSMANPEKEAFETAKNITCQKENVSVVIGFGLGYLTHELLKKKEKGHRVLVVEPNAHIIRLAFKIHNFAKYIRDGGLVIVAPGKIEIAYALQTLASQTVVGGWVVLIDDYTKKRTDDYQELTLFTQELLNSILCNTGTIAGDAGGKIADNDIACLPYVIKHRGVAELKDLFKDKPAILVSTGPSLSKNIHHLIELKDRAIIIAVGQALRALLAYDITPDFICSVDFGEVNIGHFKGLMNSGVPLVTINRTYAPLLKEWQGPKFIAATPVPGFEHMATGILTEKGHIEAGGSVAHLCFGLAQLLGCNPIVFTGQDLAFSDRSHIPLADASGPVQIAEDGHIQWKIEDQRCSLHEEGDKTYGMGPVREISGYYGIPVTTNHGLISFLTSFESLIERHLQASKK